MEKAFKFTGIFIVTLVILIGFLTCSALINPELMYDSLLKSSNILDKSPLYVESTVVSSKIDRTADGVIFNMIWNTDSKHPFISTVKSSFFYGEDRGGYRALKETLNGKAADSIYMRYWHGTEIFVRPLLLITDFNGIKLFQSVLLIAVMLALLVILIKKHYYSAIILTYGSFILTRCFYCVISIEYISVPLIALICSCYLLISEKYENNYYLFLISGIMTSFFDFLTAETLTLTVPMLFMLYDISKKERNNTLILENSKNSKLSIISSLCIKCGFSWFFGYAMTFISRWLLAAIMGISNLDNVWETLAFRITGETTDNVENVFSLVVGHSPQIGALAFNIGALLGRKYPLGNIMLIFYFTVAVILIAFIIIYLFRCSDDHQVKTWHYIVIFFIPIARIMIVSEHSLQHSFFTYRALWASVLALLFIFSEQMMWGSFKRKKTK